MNAIPSQFLIVGTTIMAVLMGVFVMVIRMRAQKKPATVKKIIIPPVAMSSGALMFIFEPFRIGLPQIAEAVGIGLVFSIILIATSKFEVRDQDVYMKASKAFPYILVGLLVFRIILKLVFANSLDVGELGGMFWTLAFAMLWPWRLAMLVKYKKVKKTIAA